MMHNVHEKYLGLIYSDEISSYEEFLEKDGLVSFHHRKIQVLATELYKVKNHLSSKIFSDLFRQKEMNTCILRIQHNYEALK